MNKQIVVGQVYYRLGLSISPIDSKVRVLEVTPTYLSIEYVGAEELGWRTWHIERFLRNHALVLNASKIWKDLNK